MNNIGSSGINTRFSSGKRSALVITALILLSGCAGLENFLQSPTARIASIELKAVDFSSVTLQLNLEVDNPNPYGLSLNAYDYSISGLDAVLVNGRVEETVTISAGGTSTIPLPITIQYSDLLSAGESLASLSEFPYEVTLGLEIAVPYLGGIRLDVSASGVLPIIRAPGIQPLTMEVLSINLSGAEISLGIRVTNRNRFGMTLNSLEGKLTAGGRDWGVVELKNGSFLKAGETLNLALRFRVSFAETGKAAWNILRGSADTDIALKGKADIDMDLEGFQNGRIPLETTAKVLVVRR